jgi:hypothetical protein
VCYRPGGFHLGGVLNIVALSCDDKMSQRNHSGQAKRALNIGTETQGGDPGAVAPGKKKKKKIIQANIYERLLASLVKKYFYHPTPLKKKN